MKKALFTTLLLFLFVFISGFLVNPTVEDYDKSWKQVEKYVDEGLPRSALAIVDEIFRKAKSEDNRPQFIKALIYKVSLQSRFEEEHLMQAILVFEEELKQAKSPEKQVIRSLLAELYRGFYQQNRWTINNRKTVEGLDDKDIRTWDAVKLNRKIRGYYLRSLDAAGTLKTTPLEDYNLILKQEDGSNFELWPSLYDLLANRALEYFSGEDVELTELSGIVSPEVRMLPLEQFLKEKSDNTDSSNITIALNLYRHLLGFHMKNENTEALIDLELRRLAFVYDHLTDQTTETQDYIKILKDLGQRYKNHPAFAKIGKQLAGLYLAESAKYVPLLGDEHRREKNEAEKVCEEVIELYPDENASEYCKSMLNRIRKKSFGLKTASATLPGKPFPALLNFRNITKLYFRIVKVDPDEDLKLREKQRQQEIMAGYLKNEAVESWSIDLPDTKDHQQHATEIRMPALENGYYVVFASDDPSFSSGGNLTYQSVWVSSLSYIVRSDDPEGNNEMFVLDRESGNRLPGVRITVYQKVYDSRQRVYHTWVVGNLVSGEDGFVSIESFAGENYGSYILDLAKDGDRLFSDAYLDFYKWQENRKPRLHTYFFTDRAIYRPGQTVYFKGIVVESKGSEVTIKAETPVEVEFLNASRKKVSSANFVSNDFGSFHGSFVIPTGGLNGRMTLKTKSGYTSFRVEEYKRPGFRVLFDTLEGQYKLNETITVTGRAEDFSGSVLSRAGVKYRVVRQAVLPRPLYGYRDFGIPWPSFPLETEIAHGFISTKTDGTFTVSFEAQPDLRIPRKLDPTFNYRIYADVTDITGEVQTGETFVRVGASSIVLEISGPETIDRENPEALTLLAANLAGAPLAVAARVSVFKLKPPSRLLNKRLWPQPDLYTIPEAGFKKEFPHDIYKDENRKNKWPKTTVLETTVRVDGEKQLLKDELNRWSPGEYLVVAQSVDKHGDTVETLRFFKLYSTAGKKIPGNEIFWTTLSREKAEPGETLKLVVGSAAKKTKVLVEIINGRQTLSSNWLVLNKGQKVVEIPVKEAYRGNFSINLTTVRLNRFYNKRFVVEVPFTNKKLDIALETHRDFLTPGKKEEWRVKISGPGGEAAAAELLAGMYDASLDRFSENAWKLKLYYPKTQSKNWKAAQFRVLSNSYLHKVQPPVFSPEPQQYPTVNWFGYYFLNRGVRMMDFGMQAMATETPATEKSAEEVVEDSDVTETEVPENGQQILAGTQKEKETAPPLRTNFNETAFFYPQLTTDSSGNLLFGFTTPDALTEWKLLMLATTKDLKTGMLVKKIKAQKELMVLPNVPRFVRQGDKLVFSAKVVNFTDREMEADVRIEFFDAISMKAVTIFASGQQKSATVRIPPKQNARLSWAVEIPANLSMLAYRIRATAGTFSDGEERMFPVLTNRMLVTETMPMPVNGGKTRIFKFDKLLNSDKIAGPVTRKDFRFTVEFTSNPAWYAVQALPYMAEGNRESISVLFNRYFANSLSAFVANSNPKIQRVFESWKRLSPDAFLSKLQQNEELKYAVLNATPWVLEAEDESEQKRRIGILFDLNRLAAEQRIALERLRESQLSSGAWPWFRGMQDDRYTTQRIVTGFAKLNSKGVIDLTKDKQLQQMLRKAVRYLDNRLKADYEKLKKKNPKGMDKNHLNSMVIQYLYARSLLTTLLPVPAQSGEAFDYYTGQAKRYWLKQTKLLQGMIALAMNRLSYRNQAEAIVRSLRERALHSEEMGMYWRQQNGWNWFRVPVETQALMIEVFSEVGNYPKEVYQMKIWLLKQKQTQKWKTSSATAEAVFSLLMYGEDLLAGDQTVKIKVGSQTIDTDNPDLGVEAGTGYFKTAWKGEEIKAGMGRIEVTNPNKSIAWGAAYWQYFENLDRITAQQSPLSLEKKLFVEVLTDAGPVIKPLEEGQKLKPGDKVIVRLNIRTDRNMEFVHLKDMRATAFEPLKPLSGYTYTGGLGYYQNITDVSTDFFMRYLNKGTYVLEYPLHVSQSGVFSNGIATIQSMYAPEFGAHSSGLRIEVKDLKK